MSQKTAASDTNNCYMDGVRVKIAEKYKPPPKITLAMTYSQRLSLNRQLQLSMPSYAFDTDAYVKEKMHDWRTVRQRACSERKQRLEEVEQQRRENDVEQRSQEHVEDELQVTTTVGKRRNDMLIPTQANIPLANLPSEPSPINISDFDPDTASPFDNLELKTLNDMEELKMVLQNEDKNKFQSLPNQTFCSYAPPSSSSTYDNGLPPFYTNFHHTQESAAYDGLQNAKTMTNLLPMNGAPPATSNVTNIMQSLQNQLQLNASNNSNTAPQPHQRNKSALSSPSNLEDPYPHLPQQSQAICESIATMGFALSRVARACKALGDDEKKIVEHLLTMAQLMDLGFSEEKVAAALIRANHDRDKALEVLIS